jgi:hypothetical protein
MLIPPPNLHRMQAEFPYQQPHPPRQSMPSSSRDAASAVARSVAAMEASNKNGHDGIGFFVIVLLSMGSIGFPIKLLHEAEGHIVTGTCRRPPRLRRTLHYPALLRFQFVNFVACACMARPHELVCSGASQWRDVSRAAGGGGGQHELPTERHCADRQRRQGHQSGASVRCPPPPYLTTSFPFHTPSSALFTLLSQLLAGQPRPLHDSARHAQARAHVQPHRPKARSVACYSCTCTCIRFFLGSRSFAALGQHARTCAPPSRSHL